MLIFINLRMQYCMFNKDKFLILKKILLFMMESTTYTIVKKCGSEKAFVRYCGQEK